MKTLLFRTIFLLEIVLIFCIHGNIFQQKKKKIEKETKEKQFLFWEKPNNIFTEIFLGILHKLDWKQIKVQEEEQKKNLKRCHLYLAFGRTFNELFSTKEQSNIEHTQIPETWNFNRQKIRENKKEPTREKKKLHHYKY